MPAKEAKHKTASMKYFLRFDQFWGFVRWVLRDSIEGMGLEDVPMDLLGRRLAVESGRLRLVSSCALFSAHGLPSPPDGRLSLKILCPS